MAFIQNDITEKFKQQAKYLLDSSIVRRYNEIAERLGWDKTALSNVLNGRRNIPLDVYSQFTDVYKDDIKTPEQVEEDYKDKYIRLLEQQLKEKEAALQRLQEHLNRLVSSEKLEAYLQSLLSLANTQLDVLVEHRAVMEKADQKKLKKAADNVYDEYQRHYEGNRS